MGWAEEIFLAETISGRFGSVSFQIFQEFAVFTERLFTLAFTLVGLCQMIMRPWVIRVEGEEAFVFCNRLAKGPQRRAGGRARRQPVAFSCSSPAGLLSEPWCFPADIPSLSANIISLRFFESSRTFAPPYGQREYKTRFANSQTRFVNYEISLQHPAPGRVAPLSVNSLWRIDRTGALLRNQIDDWMRIQPDWTSSVFNTGTGNTDPGQWEVGTYTVELYVEGRKVAEGKFEIY